MAASHRAAKLAASCLQIPINPSTGVRVAQCEREDPLEALAAAAATAALEEEEEEEPEEEEERGALWSARARVMRGRDVGCGWASPGRPRGWCASLPGGGPCLTTRRLVPIIRAW